MATPIDALRRRFRHAHNRRALDELRHEVARSIRQVADQMDDAGSDDARLLRSRSVGLAAIRRAPLVAMSRAAYSP